ncbi:hypothetical protein LL033_00655 [Clostridium estertheticum]|uniref:hypothetical protein n=1 Tax=Clostridium estertheticum TaxID=238834 RepID=UPI00227B5192|nr:hypothetical protein [Clostridium estertheticum]WAG55776.1 hypothetical protein LL033_00655 [Clostridium estertheticum]
MNIDWQSFFLGVITVSLVSINIYIKKIYDLLKKKWIGLICTDLSLTEEQIIALYVSKFSLKYVNLIWTLEKNFKVFPMIL